MRTTIVLFALLLSMSAAAAAAGFDLGNRLPAKPLDRSVYQPPAEPPRQGGNTIEEAVPISVPGTYPGTTAGYQNNYDEMCPYGGGAPDVVYAVMLDIAMILDFDLCYSSYDTKIFIYDENLNFVACNDDFHFDEPCLLYTSKLENIALQAGVTYYVIVDGYGSAAGPYQLDITAHEPCVITCPAGAQLENEPPLQNGYEDAHNGGCNSPQFANPFQPITQPIFCGGSVGVVQDVIIGPCNEATMTIVGAPGSLVWFWVGPTTFTGPVNEYNYILHLNLDEPVQTESHSWTNVKSLFH